MAKDAWTTGEVEAWLLNDEDMYEQVVALARKRGELGRTQFRSRLKRWCKEWAIERRMGELRGYHMQMVDWEMVADTIYSMAKETSND